MPLSTGQKLDNNRYTIQTRLGQGGMGAVYIATDQNLGDDLVAIKENLLESQRQRQQFEREANLLYRLRHPNLPGVTNYFTDKETAGQYLVMQYIEGEDLQQVLSGNGGLLPEEQVIAWLSGVMDALTFMHTRVDSATGTAQPILHRDIKPSNIKLTPQGEVFLVDFGLAKPESLGTTISGARGVTPGFSPPEQYADSGGRTTPQTDIYALGATLYALLTKRIPPAATQIIGGVAELQAPRLFNTNISPNTERVILKAMQLNVADRYQSVDEMHHALGRGNALGKMPKFGKRVAVRSAGAQSPRTQPSSRRQPTFLRTLIGLLLTAIVLLFGFVLYEQVAQPPILPDDDVASNSTPTTELEGNPKVDNGNTEDGNTEDGNTEDGNTEDGNTEDGNTDQPPPTKLAIRDDSATEPPAATEADASSANTLGGGGGTTPTPTQSPTNVPIEEPTDTPTATAVPATVTATPIVRPTERPSNTPRPTDAPDPLPEEEEQERAIQTRVAATLTARPTTTNSPTTNPPTSTSTDTPQPPTETPVPPTNTPNPRTVTPVPPTNTSIPPTETPNPPTNTPIPLPPTDTPTPQPPTIPDFASSGRFNDTVLNAAFVRVNAGNFSYGSTQAEIDKGLAICRQYSGDKCHARDFENETTSGNSGLFGGARSIPINEFWIMETEVSNAQFDACIQAGRCQNPQGGSRAQGPPDHPVRLLNSSDAEAFASWACGRLPTELEWEKAARGQDSRIYPWGNEWSAQNANSCGGECNKSTVTGITRPNDGQTTTAPVTSFAGGRSPYGLYHMVGNVREWVATVWEHQGMDRPFMLKGGSFYDFPDVMRTAERLRWPKDDDGTITAGFRIVRDRVDSCPFN